VHLSLSKKINQGKKTLYQKEEECTRKVKKEGETEEVTLATEELALLVRSR
jgi:hypothetical protein